MFLAACRTPNVLLLLHERGQGVVREHQAAVV